MARQNTMLITEQMAARPVTRSSISHRSGSVTTKNRVGAMPNAVATPKAVTAATMQGIRAE